MQLEQDLIEICKLLYSKEYVSGTDGNVSCRIGDNRIICTPTATPKGKIRISDLITIDLAGKKVKGEKLPSTEIKMHLKIYEKRPDINAVVHAHPVYATGFASSLTAIDQCVLPEVILGLGAVPLCKYATPSTEEVVKSIEENVLMTNAVLLQNHGAVAYGRNIWDAYYKMEKLEHTAKILFVSKLLGGEKLLTNTEYEKLIDVNETTYKLNLDHNIKCQTACGSNPGKETNQIQKIVKEIIKDIQRR